MEKYLVVHVTKYHGNTVPEDIDVKVITATDIISARHTAINNYFASNSPSDDWYSLWQEEYEEEYEISDKDELIEFLVEDQNRFKNTNWCSYCSCEGCYNTFCVIPFNQFLSPSIE